MYGLLYFIGVTLVWIAIAAAIVHVLMDNRQPAKTMAWVLVIFFVPVAGIILYLFFGISYRKQRMVSQRSLDQLSKRSMLEFVEQQDLIVPERHQQLIDLFINQNLSLPFMGSTYTLLTSGYAFIPRLMADIAAARHHIHIGMYIIEDDALGRLLSDALRAKARAGVEVRLVYDDVGCWRVRRHFFELMREDGIEVVPFLPVRFPAFTSKANYRNHRKMIVIDGRVGYIGGMNLAERYVKGIEAERKRLPWRDTMVRMEGGIVCALQRAFLVDWYFADRTLMTGKEYYPSFDIQNTSLAQIVTSGPITIHPEIMQGYVRIILAARHYLYIETPYFLPNEPVLFAIKTAATAGVDVRILCSRYSDVRLTEWASRSYLREVTEAGAKVSLYEGGFLHSKLLVCDDELCACGSANMDFRSLENNFEANVFIYDEAMAKQVKEVFLSDLQQSVLLDTLPDYVRPTFARRLWESLARLFSPLL